MSLNKEQLQALIETDCTQQGAVSVPGAILKELVDSYIESVATSKADAAKDAAIAAAAITATSKADAAKDAAIAAAAITAASLADAAAGAVITSQTAIADLAPEATVDLVAPVVNSILAALRANNILETESAE